MSEQDPLARYRDRWLTEDEREQALYIAHTHGIAVTVRRLQLGNIDGPHFGTVRTVPITRALPNKN